MGNDSLHLEAIEFEAQSDFYRAAPADVRAAHAIEVHQSGAATCLTSRGLEPAVMFRRAGGLGVEHETSESELDAVLAYMHQHGLAYAVPVAPDAQPPALAEWLERRAFTRGYAWMKFRRSCTAPPQVTSDLEIRVIGHQLGDEFGRVVAEGFGAPPTVARWVAGVTDRPNWICVMAFAGNIPVAAGAVYVSGEYAWLGFGATLTSHRRQGAQSALLARRIGEAAARGARWAVTETGARVADKPSNSYRNILRAGFEEMYVRQNYMSPAP